MSRYDNTKRNQYNSTPRKVFEAYIDRMAVKRARDKEDHRADVQALIKRLLNLEEQLTLISEHQQAHCHDLDLLAEKADTVPKHGREGL